MKYTGIVRKIDDLGRVVIPMELREKLKIQKNDSMEIFVNNNAVVLQKYEESCIFCQNTRNLIIFNEKQICQRCVKRIKQSC